MFTSLLFLPSFWRIQNKLSPYGYAKDCRERINIKKFPISFVPHHFRTILISQSEGMKKKLEMKIFLYVLIAVLSSSVVVGKKKERKEKWVYAPHNTLTLIQLFAFSLQIVHVCARIFSSSHMLLFFRFFNIRYSYRTKFWIWKFSFAHKLKFNTHLKRERTKNSRRRQWKLEFCSSLY